MALSSKLICLVLLVQNIYGQGVGVNSDVSKDSKRQLQVDAKQPWFEEIIALRKGEIKRCGKRNDIPPTNGEVCAMKEKICFFGTQQCGVLPHPTTKCQCSGGDEATNSPGKWTCAPELCPACPTEAPKTGDVCTNEGALCSYGEDSCCGMTVPYSACACKDGTYKCAFSDSCLLPVCLFKNWDALIGTSCAEATAEILKEYPGLSVICTTEKPAVTDDDFNTNRIYIVVDANQVVVGAPTIG